MSGFTMSATRPAQVKWLSLLLLASAVFMALLGWSASAYYVPATCLALLAALLWSGRAGGFVKWVLILNQLGAVVLILVLWLGSGLGNAKLDVAGVALLLNLLCGGPLASLLGGVMLPGLRRGRRLRQWFTPRAL
jgi:hypothetical protein